MEAVVAANRLKELRLEKGFTQQGLSEASGVAQGHISMLERGERGKRWSLSVASKIARALGVPVEELVQDPE